ncbi:hypothetical protein DDZ14_11705 [Maritimibacter sp. 55A14]|uniref:porin n=1 Tax=Maritimibacter sp. 55A14 TaxID=2174844 RepID=UPI000D604F20|nr:porin [Maritimibacter sp. 55A14]PWE32113.1 hypothetical protein DDZ14_11705 [Maritimibacter sp. 55A14]
MKKSILFTASALALLASPVAAQQFTQAQLDWLNENYVPRTEIGKNGAVTHGKSGVRLKLSGQVNRAILFTDDGDETDHFFVDNDNSSTRVRFQGEGDVGDYTIFTNIEVQFESNSTADVSQLDDTTGGASFTERKLEVGVKGPIGKLSLGQGDMASNGTSEVDLSGTGVIGYSGIADFAGGILFRDETTGVLSGTTIGDVFTQFDGQSRRDRIRYDSPTLAGFTASTSFGEDDRWDAALRYAGEFGSIRVEGAAAYGSDNNSDEILNGSVSFLETNSGISVTLAYGEEDLDVNPNNIDPQFYYAKLGWQTNGLTSLGKTAFAIDYTQADELDPDGSGALTGVDGEFTSYGIFVVQNIDAAGTELYAGVRNHEYDSPATNFDDILAAMVGARVKF